MIRARHLDLRELHGFDPPMDCFILRTFLSVITVTDRPKRRLSLKFFSSSMKRPDSVLPGTLDLNAFCHSKIRRLLKAIWCQCEHLNECLIQTDNDTWSLVRILFSFSNKRNKADNYPAQEHSWRRKYISMFRFEEIWPWIAYRQTNVCSRFCYGPAFRWKIFNVLLILFWFST